MYLKDITAKEPEERWQCDYVKAPTELDGLVKEDQDTLIEFQAIYRPDEFADADGMQPPSSMEERKEKTRRTRLKASLLNVVAKVEEIEQQQGIETRWTPEDHRYQDAERFLKRGGFIAVLDELEGRVVQCLFELSKANLAGTGETSFCIFLQVLILST
jgi:hypothetical protein